MQLGMTDTDSHWFQFLGNLGVHEAGYLDGDGSLVPKEAGLSPARRARDVAHAMWRGAQCTADFTTVDHLALADRAARGRARLVRHPAPRLLTPLRRPDWRVDGPDSRVR